MIRKLGQAVECISAPVYFAPEPQLNYSRLGLRGYWRGYFASRAACLGRPSAATVTQLFGGFAPAMVARAVPEVWTIADPEDVLAARLEGARSALGRLLGDAPLAEARAAATATTAALDFGCTPLAAAQATVGEPSDDIGAVWVACTVLREYRGDLHLEVLRNFDLAWPEPHLLLAGIGRLDPRQREYRGWTEAEWAAAEQSLRNRGWYGTAQGQRIVDDIDEGTDALMADAFGAAGVDAAALFDALRPLARLSATDVPFPNAIGMPRPSFLASPA